MSSVYLPLFDKPTLVRRLLWIATLILVALILVNIYFPLFVFFTSHLPISILLSWFLYQTIYLTLYGIWIERARKLRGRTENELRRFAKTGERESSMLTMGSIFIAASFLLLTFSNQKDLDGWIRIVMALASPILYGIWLFSIQLSSRLMDDATSEVELIAEHVLQGDLHSDDCRQTRGVAHVKRKFYGARNGRGLMMKVRRNHWIFYLNLLILLSLTVIWLQ